MTPPAFDGTEAEIQHGSGRYADNEHMLLVIARRRSTLQLADRIVVLDKGRVDIGTRAELDAVSDVSLADERRGDFRPCPGRTTYAGGPHKRRR